MICIIEVLQFCDIDTYKVKVYKKKISYEKRTYLLGKNKLPKIQLPNSHITPYRNKLSHWIKVITVLNPPLSIS